MARLRIDALPRQTTRGTIVRLLEQVGEIGRDKIGMIEIQGRSATIEIPDGWEARLVKAMDGAMLGTQHVRVWYDVATTSRGTEDHFQRLLRLLELESEEEARRAAKEAADGIEVNGNTLSGLIVKDETAGLGGRAVLTLGKKGEQNLPWTRLGVGSPVLLLEENRRGHSGWRGIVSHRLPRSMQVALESWPEPEHDQPVFRLALAQDEVARQRQRIAMERARSAAGDRLARLREVLIGNEQPSFRPAPKRPVHESTDTIQWLDPHLNDSQREAIRLALTADDLAVIHGPPGTGKTTTVVELIRQAIRRGEKVLACAPSNLAVDNLLERLVAAGERAIRIGHPARVLPELREHTLDLIVEAHPDLQVARKLIREASSLRDKAGKWTRGKPQPGAKQQMREEARDLIRDAQRIETQVIEHVIHSADVVCVTMTAIGSEVLGQRHFDLAVIDEACQSTEPAGWIPLLRSERVVLAGDHRQLSPTVLSREAERQGFGLSLMERVVDLFGDTVARRLDVQYRMHESIMQFSSHEFYDGTLLADAAVREHVLADLPAVQASSLTTTPLEFIDTAGAGYDEELDPKGESRRNPQEAELVVKQVQRLLDAGLSTGQMAIIAPYAAQTRLLREHLQHAYNDLEIDTVDGFQGREKEAIIISLVRSNSACEIGFLADTRRMNVALTRARRKLIVVGDSATIGIHDFYQRLLAHFEQHAAYHTVWEYL